MNQSVLSTQLTADDGPLIADLIMQAEHLAFELCAPFLLMVGVDVRDVPDISLTLPFLALLAVPALEAMDLLQSACHLTPLSPASLEDLLQITIFLVRPIPRLAHVFLFNC